MGGRGKSKGGKIKPKVTGAEGAEKKAKETKKDRSSGKGVAEDNVKTGTR